MTTLTNPTNATLIETSAPKKERKKGSGSKFNPAKYAIVRAWVIAKNAATAHNTNALNVALKGLVKPSEYFKESLIMAWVEAKAKAKKEKIEAYKLHKVPKKSLRKILNNISGFLIVNEIVEFKTGDTSDKIIAKAVANKDATDCRIGLAECIFDARYTTVSARSTARHIRNSIEETVATGVVPDMVADQVAY